MTSLTFLIPLALLLGALALAGFFWAMRHGQFDDLDGAGMRILIDEDGTVDGAGDVRFDDGNYPPPA